FDLRTLLPNANGYLNGDVRHTLKVYGAKTFVLSATHSLSLGAGYTGESGAPTSYVGYDAVTTAPIVFLSQRGDGPRLPWVHTVDGRIAYDLRLPRSSTLTVSADLFNLFNFSSRTSVDQTFTVPTTYTVPVQGTTAGQLE